MIEIFIPASVIQAFALLTAAKTLPLLRTRLQEEVWDSVQREGRFRRKAFVQRAFKAVRDALSLYAFIVVLFGFRSGHSGMEMVLALFQMTGFEHLLGAVGAVAMFEGRLVRASLRQWMALLLQSFLGAVKRFFGALVLGLVLPDVFLDVATGFLVTAVLVITCRSIWAVRKPWWALRLRIWWIKQSSRLRSSRKKRVERPSVPDTDSSGSDGGSPPPKGGSRGFMRWLHLGSRVSEALKDLVPTIPERGGEDP